MFPFPTITTSYMTPLHMETSVYLIHRNSSDAGKLLSSNSKSKRSLGHTCFSWNCGCFTTPLATAKGPRGFDKVKSFWLDRMSNNIKEPKKKRSILLYNVQDAFSNTKYTLLPCFQSPWAEVIQKLGVNQDLIIQILVLPNSRINENVKHS